MISSRRGADPVTDSASDRVRFGDFALDLETGELFQNGEAVDLRPQASRALVLLVGRAGWVVSREELRRALWGDMRVDWDQGTNQVIRQVRKAVGDDARNPSFLHTVSRRGYRFENPAPARSPTRPGASSRKSSLRRSDRPPRLLYFSAGVATTLALPLAFLLVCGLLFAQ